MGQFFPQKFSDPLQPYVRRHVTSPGGQLGRGLGDEEAQRWKGGWARRAGVASSSMGTLSGGCLINWDGIHMDEL